MRAEAPGGGGGEEGGGGGGGGLSALSLSLSLTHPLRKGKVGKRETRGKTQERERKKRKRLSRTGCPPGLCRVRLNYKFVSCKGQNVHLWL